MSIISFNANSNTVMPYRLNFAAPSLHYRVEEEEHFFRQLQQELRQTEFTLTLHSFELTDSMWNMTLTFCSYPGVEDIDLIRASISDLYMFIQKTPLLRARWFSQSEGMWCIFIVNVVKD